MNRTTIKCHSETQSYLEEQSVVQDLRFIGRRLLSRYVICEEPIKFENKGNIIRRHRKVGRGAGSGRGSLALATCVGAAPLSLKGFIRQHCRETAFVVLNSTFRCGEGVLLSFLPRFINDKNEKRLIMNFNRSIRIPLFLSLQHTVLTTCQSFGNKSLLRTMHLYPLKASIFPLYCPYFF